MTVHSGRFGVIDGHAAVRNWNISETSTPAKHVSSATKWGTGRRSGIKAWSGSLGAFGGAPAKLPGEFFAFKGYTAPDDDESGDGICMEGSAVVDSVAITWNWTTAEIISYVLNFSGHLALTETSEEYTDASVPSQPSLLVAAVPTWCVPAGTHAPWAAVTQMVLNLSCANTSYVNADTAGLTGRKSGPAIDWTLAVSEQNAAKTGRPAIGSLVELKLFTTALLFWSLKWGMVKDYSNLQVNRENGEVIARTVNIEMAGFDDTGAAGAIPLPGGAAAWWPAP